MHFKDYFSVLIREEKHTAVYAVYIKYENCSNRGSVFLNNHIIVSITCITYNHEKYIVDAIESFLMQKTNFDFEIVIGEDCSTDNTRKIIDEYRKKYPDKINLVTSEFNVGMQKNAQRVFDASRGKYIAICEGDDYWTDPYKLQKQVDYMEQNPSCTMCFHNGICVDVSSENMERSLIFPPKGFNGKYYHGEKWKYNAGEIVLLNSLPTNSILYPKYAMENAPHWYHTAFAGDICIEFLCTYAGYAHYIDEAMSVYRYNVANSVTTIWKQEDKKSKLKRIERQEKLFALLDAFDQYSNEQYSNYFSFAKSLDKLFYAIEENTVKDFINSSEYKMMVNHISSQDKMKLYIRAYCPAIYPFVKSIYKKLKG